MGRSPEMPKRQSPDWPSWLRAMMLGEARRDGTGVDDRPRQAAVDLGVGLGHVEEAKHLLALEPGHLEGPLDEVPVAILPQESHGGFARLRHAGDHVHGPGFVRRQRQRAADRHDGIEDGAFGVGQFGVAGIVVRMPRDSRPSVPGR